MDSMRSLNSSLPSNPTTQPPEVLLQAFKTAALSVTNLYKSAAADQAQSRNLGYQDALEDLRAFLDKEGLGLSDGEGSKIRSWIVERIDGTGVAANDSEDDNDKRNRSTSPNVSRKISGETNRSSRQSRSASPQRTEQPTSAQPPPATVFTFAAGPHFPASTQEDVDMKCTDAPSIIQADSPPSHPLIAPPSVRLEVVPRAPRTPLRNHNRINGRSSVRDSTASIGSKRKFHFNEFFDISNIGNGKDAFGGGGKRGRYI